MKVRKWCGEKKRKKEKRIHGVLVQKIKTTYEKKYRELKKQNKKILIVSNGCETTQYNPYEFFLLQIYI